MRRRAEGDPCLSEGCGFSRAGGPEAHRVRFWGGVRAPEKPAWGGEPGGSQGGFLGGSRPPL